MKKSIYVLLLLSSFTTEICQKNTSLALSNVANSITIGCPTCIANIEQPADETDSKKKTKNPDQQNSKKENTQSKNKEQETLRQAQDNRENG
ncbi:hypothetical protein ACFLYA_00025 [Candidatus Dependentiae bacterium]